VQIHSFKFTSDRRKNKMANRSTHFSFFRLLQRLCALGLAEERSQTEHCRHERPLPLKLAVFIDIENFGNSAAIRSVFDFLAQGWNPICRRAYGFGLVRHRDLFRDLSIIPIEILHNTTGKNAADIALVIDAMTELSLGRSEAFCIVSGDGDFSRLAQIIRERGLPVLVFGPESTPVALRTACTEFHLLQSKPSQDKESSAPEGLTRPSDPANQRTAIKKGSAELIDLVFRLAAGKGKTTLSAINQAGCREYEGFCSKQYGKQKLTVLLRGLGPFEVRPVRNSMGIVEDYEVRPKTPGVAQPEGSEKGCLCGAPQLSQKGE